MSVNWDEEYERDAAERRAAAEAADKDVALQNRLAKKRAEEFERGVRLGWWDKDGNPLPQPDGDDEEGDEDDGE